MDCSPPGSSVHRIFQVRILEWITISFSRGSSQTQGLNLCLLNCRQIHYCGATWEALLLNLFIFKTAKVASVIRSLGEDL